MAERIQEHPIFGDRDYPRYEVQIGNSSILMRGLERYNGGWKKTYNIIDEDMRSCNVVMPEYFIPDISMNQTKMIKKEIKEENIDILFGHIQNCAEDKTAKIICIDPAHGPYFRMVQWGELSLPAVLSGIVSILSFKAYGYNASSILALGTLGSFLPIVELYNQQEDAIAFQTGKLENLSQKSPFTMKFGILDARNVVRARAIQTILSEDKEPKRYYMSTAIYHLLATHYYLTHPKELEWKWVFYKRMPYIEKKARYYEFEETEQGNEWVRTKTEKIR